MREVKLRALTRGESDPDVVVLLVERLEEEWERSYKDEEDVEELKGEISALEEEKDKLEDRVDELEGEAAALKSEVDRLHKQIAEDERGLT